MYEFKLYIVGRTPESLTITDELVKLLKDALDNDCSLEVIDVIENPELAERAKILATPTLVKVAPDPVKKIIGDLSDPETVLPALGIIRQKINK